MGFRRLALRLALTSGMALAGLAMVPSPAQAVENQCTTVLENPHVSAGAGGIIVKARYTCHASNSFATSKSRRRTRGGS
jgi:hypothetical protein